jgi:hypothetical protein
VPVLKNSAGSGLATTGVGAVVYAALLLLAAHGCGPLKSPAAEGARPLRSAPRPAPLVVTTGPTAVAPSGSSLRPVAILSGLGFKMSDGSERRYDARQRRWVAAPSRAPSRTPRPAD